MSRSPYRRLTWKRRNLTGYTQAWLGTDHLLLVNATNYTERYQRFFFSDIEAIVVTEMSSRIVQGVLALLALACVFLHLQYRFYVGWTFLVPSGIFVLALGVDFMRGPRCRCVVQTAVSRERLKSVDRVRTARKLIAMLTPPIKAAQGAVTPEAIAQALSSTSEVQQVATPPEPPAVTAGRGYLLEVLFGVLLLDSLLAWLATRSQLTTALGAFIVVFSAELLLGIVALIRTSSRASISYILVALTVVISLIDLFAWSGPATWHSFANLIQQRQSPGQALLLDDPISVSAQTVWLMVGWRLAVGLLGLASCYFERREEGA
jgi:hypothetical protein